jgi:hypothetical protein
MNKNFQFFYFLLMTAILFFEIVHVNTKLGDIQDKVNFLDKKLVAIMIKDKVPYDY